MQFSNRPNDFDSPPFPMSQAVWQTIAARLAFSPQQKRIVELILRARSDKEIATELALTVPTVRTYTKRIYARTGTRDRISLVLLIFAMTQPSDSQDE